MAKKGRKGKQWRGVRPAVPASASVVREPAVTASAPPAPRSTATYRPPSPAITPRPAPTITTNYPAIMADLRMVGVIFVVVAVVFVALHFVLK
ncbi:MAG: hypothetical protein HYX89_04115 [Chloroflexi bacterium]|nr:hypothetical protein [Chloroflexota bacterium]